MIPAKEAKEMLYRMLSENFVALQVGGGGGRLFEPPNMIGVPEPPMPGSLRLHVG